MGSARGTADQAPHVRVTPGKSARLSRGKRRNPWKRSCHILAAACLLASFGCAGSGSTQGGADSSTSVASRVTFETMAAERLAATRARLDSLQGELPHSTGELQAAMQVRAAQLAAERDSATRRLALLKSATDDEWQTMRLAVADALDSLETRIDRLSDQLRKPSRSGRPRA
jgi:hypothetical protein